MGVVTKVKTAIGALVNRVISGERKKNLADLITTAEGWRPDATNYSYSDEMEHRVNYLRGAMQADMKNEIERRFPQTYKDIEKEQVNLPLYRKEMRDKAKCFLGSAELFLVDGEGKRVDGPAQDRFTDLMKQSRFLSCLRSADLYTQACHRVMAKVWWDRRQERARVTVWPPHLVYVVPDPNRWWDVDAAHAVLFELPSVDGLSDTSPRYEIWGVRDPEAEASTGQETLHFTTDGETDFQQNDEDVNPFEDPRTGKPMYPFVWWQDDDSTELYTIGREDALTINRAVNSGLTDVRQGVHFLGSPVPVHTMAPKGGELGVKTVSPGVVIDLVNGASLEFKHPDMKAGDLYDFYEKLADANAMLEGLPSTAMRRESAAPEAGYALKIRNKPLEEHREDMLELFTPQAEETAFRLAVVHNLYATDKIDGLDGYSVHIEPGEFMVDEDPEAMGRRYAAEIEADVSTAKDWRKDRYNEDDDQADEAIQANMEFNMERAKNRSVASPFAMGGAANAIADRLEKPEEPEEEEEETEEE